VSRSIRILLAVVLLAVVGGGYYKLVLAPKRVEADDLAVKIATAQQQLAQTQALIGTYKGARDEYTTNYATVVRLGKAVPTDDDTRSLLVQLDATAKRSGVEFSTLNVANSSASAAPGTVNVGAYSAQPFGLTFDGTFGTLGNFLARIDQFVTLDGDTINARGRLMHVEGVQLAPGGGGWPSLTAQITASAYLLPETPAAPAAADPATTQAASTTSTTSTPTDSDLAGAQAR
jgi:Tfp pilus assembly protein PilO